MPKIPVRVKQTCGGLQSKGNASGPLSSLIAFVRGEGFVGSFCFGFLQALVGFALAKLQPIGVGTFGFFIPLFAFAHLPQVDDVRHRAKVSQRRFWLHRVAGR